jgi:hypothetical protein
MDDLGLIIFVMLGAPALLLGALVLLAEIFPDKF